jgi:hypothetical protein
MGMQEGFLWKYFVTAPHVQPSMKMDENFATEGYYKMLENSKPDSDSYIEKCLFDLESDPDEKKNLVGDARFAEVRADLAVRLRRCMVKAGEEAPAIYPFGTGLPRRY